MATRVRYTIPSPSLLPNTELFHWKDRIIHLPRNYTGKSIECKSGFIELLKSLDIFSFKNLDIPQKEEAFGKAWHELVKTLPDEPFAKNLVKVIEIAGMAFLLIIGAKACL
jgi:hypothetical protein